MISLNAFVTVKPYFKKFVVFRVPLVGDPHVRSQLTRILFNNGVAYAFPYEVYLYFKGKPNETSNMIKEIIKQDTIGSKLIVSSLLETEKQYLTINDTVIIKPIVYLAIEKILELRGFHVLQNVKKAIPKINNEENMKKELVTSLTDDVIVLRGLRYMFEVRPSGYGILWLDVYSPPYNRQSMKLLSPKEIKRLDMMEQYYNEAVLKPKDRLDMLHKIIKILCNATEMLTLEFPDGDAIQFSMELLHLEAIEER